jgi:signal transduction histidine kinase
MFLGGIFYWLTIGMEEDLIEETLSTELENYINRYAINPYTLPPSSTHIRGYVINGKIPDSFPAPLLNLSPGLSHVQIGDSGYFVELREKNDTRFFMLYADQLIKHREKQYFGFLASGIGLMTLLSGILGLWLARQVILPVTKLAQQVSTMGPDFSPVTIKEERPHDEVAELSHAINGYHQRLAEFNERERAFTSNVSHELRTPLTVIEGASEVMLSDQELSQENHKRIERIARAATQMTRLTTALLTLAREESGNTSKYQCAVGKLLRQVLDEHRYLLAHKPVKVELTINSNFHTNDDPILLYVVLANIIRNAFSYTNKGIVHVRLENKRVIIEDTGTGMKHDQLQKMFDRYYSDNRSKGGHGIGLSLVWRICERYGWKISANSREGYGTSMELILD